MINRILISRYIENAPGLAHSDLYCELEVIEPSTRIAAAELFDHIDGRITSIKRVVRRKVVYD